MKKYVNGFDRPRFLIRNPFSGQQYTIDLSSRYQYLTEYYEKISAYTKLLNGAKDKQFLHYDMEWHLDYSKMIEASDLLAIQRIEQADAAGYEITLIPHIDYPWRAFRVFILDEKREIALSPHFRGNGTYNLSFSITFVNAQTVLDPQISDTNQMPLLCCMLHPKLTILNS